MIEQTMWKFEERAGNLRNGEVEIHENNISLLYECLCLNLVLQPPPPQYRAFRGKAKWHDIRGADFTVYCINVL